MVLGLKGTWQWGGFSRFLQKLVPYESLKLTFEPFRFWLRIRRDIHSKNDSPLSPKRGVAESPQSRRLPTSPIWGVSYWIFLKKTLHLWYGESSTPRTSDMVSRRLPISLSRRVADPAYHQYGEVTTPHIVESGSRRLRGSVIRGVVTGFQRKNLSGINF